MCTDDTNMLYTLLNKYTSRISMCVVKSLKELAAEAVPQEAVHTELSCDIIMLLEYYRTTIMTCKHGTKWPYRCGKLSGLSVRCCGCTERWDNNRWVGNEVRCGHFHFECSATCLDGGYSDSSDDSVAASVEDYKARIYNI